MFIFAGIYHNRCQHWKCNTYYHIADCYDSYIFHGYPKCIFRQYLPIIFQSYPYVYIGTIPFKKRFNDCCKKGIIFEGTQEKKYGYQKKVGIFVFPDPFQKTAFLMRYGLHYYLLLSQNLKLQFLF